MLSVAESIFAAASEIGLKCLTMIGSQARYKFVQDGECSQSCGCVLDLLQCLTIKHPVGHLILSGTAAHHKQHRCGTKTLLAMTVLLMQAAEALITEGVAVEDIINGFHKGLQYVIENIQTIPIEYFLELAVDSCDDHTLDESEKLNDKIANFDIHCEDSDDISWYFEDRNEASLLYKDYGATNIFDLNLGQPEHITSKIANNCFSSLKDNEDDFDEFEDCFKSPNNSKIEKEDWKQTDHSPVVSNSETSQHSINDLQHGSSNLSHILQTITNSSLNVDKDKILNRSRHIGTIQTLSLEHQNKTENQDTNVNGTIFSGGVSNKNEKTSDYVNQSEFQACLSRTPPVSTDAEFTHAFMSQEPHDNLSHPSQSLQYRRLIQGVCHNQTSLVPLITELFLQQNNNDQSLRFDVECLYCCQVSQMSPSKSCVVPGIVIKTTLQQLQLLCQHPKTTHKALFINGDLTSTYKHKGHKPTLEGKQISKTVQEVSTQQKWIESFFKILQQHGVSVVFVRGHVSPDLELACAGEGVMFISNVPIKVMQSMSADSDVEMVTYISECTRYNVASGVSLSPWHPQWLDNLKESLSHCYVVINCNNPGTMTAVLCSWNEDLTGMMEESFWHQVYRLSNIVRQGSCLPGTGITELNASDLLLNYSNDSRSTENEIFQQLSVAFKTYFFIIQKNNGNDLYCASDAYNLSKSEECLFLDDYVSKIEAWNGSLYILRQLLYVDMEIITNADSSLML